MDHSTVSGSVESSVQVGFAGQYQVGGRNKQELNIGSVKDSHIAGDVYLDAKVGRVIQGRGGRGNTQRMSMATVR